MLCSSRERVAASTFKIQYSIARGDRPDRELGGCWASPTLSRKLNRGT